MIKGSFVVLSIKHKISHKPDKCATHCLINFGPKYNFKDIFINHGFCSNGTFSTEVEVYKNFKEANKVAFAYSWKVIDTSICIYIFKLYLIKIRNIFLYLFTFILTSVKNNRVYLEFTKFQNY